MGENIKLKEYYLQKLLDFKVLQILIIKFLFIRNSILEYNINIRLKYKLNIIS